MRIMKYSLGATGVQDGD